jgi:superfamily II DNA or RNA helicase
MKVVVDTYAWLPKAELTPLQQQALKANLTITPRKFSGFPGPPPTPIKLYEEKDDVLGIPRSFFMENRKPHHEIVDNTTLGRPDLWGGCPVFSGTLRETQAEALEKVSGLFHGGSYGGIVRAVTGWGKTVWTCALIARMQVPTLVVVHKEFLLNQWKERIEQFLPGTKVGIVQQDRCEFRDHGVAIGMIHSLVGDRDYGPDFWGWPGLVVSDECHRIAAETWSVVPTRFKARWRLGVSATPRRKDGADSVFFNHIGPVVFAAEEQRLKPKVRRVWTDFKLVQTATLNPDIVSKNVVLKFMCGNAARNKTIVEQLILAVVAGRKPIVLSERLNHLDTIEQLFKREWGQRQNAPVPSTGFYVGGMKEEELDTAADAQVIFATRQFAEEGLDIPALDTIFLITPFSDVEQAVGRILRPCPGKKDPVVVDFVDPKVASCVKSAQYRDRFYASKGWV